MIVRCLRDVLPGEELTISYDELMNPKRERAKSLKSNYGFDLHDDGRRRRRAGRSFASFRNSFDWRT